jgi:glycosyltransferase involved in cell wall biosynthesis
MKISIVTVCRNSEATIRSTIESVLAQTYSDIEYIIVDGASTDNTLSIVNEYRGRIHRIISEPDNGIYDAMNKGIKISTGDYLGILNSDDFFASNEIISGLAAFLKNHPFLDASYGDVVFVEKNNIEKNIRFYSSADFSPKLLRWGIMFPQARFSQTELVRTNSAFYKLDYLLLRL